MPRGNPRDGFEGTLGIHLRPASAIEPPTYAGIAMMRPSVSSLPSSSDHSSADFVGSRVSPSACRRSASSTTSIVAATSSPPAATTSSCDRNRNRASLTDANASSRPRPEGYTR